MRPALPVRQGHFPSDARKRHAVTRFARILALLLAAPAADAATIAGKVTGPDGAPFRGAFVQARHAGLKMTVSVLSDNDGRYVVENLPAGEYRVLVKTVGYKADVRAGVKLEADQNAVLRLRPAEGADPLDRHFDLSGPRCCCRMRAARRPCSIIA